MQKKFRAFAIAIPFLLFMAGEQKAVPVPEIIRGEADPRPLEEKQAPPVADKTVPAQQPKPATATPRRPDGLGRTNQKRKRQQPGRNSPTQIAAHRLDIIDRDYSRRTKRHLVITSFRRTPAQQARALRNNIRRYGLAYVLSLYRHSPAIREIANAYRANRQKPQEAQRKMTAVIQDQIARGVYVSAHLRGQAADIRSRGRNGARLSILRDVARKAGAKVSVERDHFHVNLV